MQKIGGLSSRKMHQTRARSEGYKTLFENDNVNCFADARVPNLINRVPEAATGARVPILIRSLPRKSALVILWCSSGRVGGVLLDEG